MKQNFPLTEPLKVPGWFVRFITFENETKKTDGQNDRAENVAARKTLVADSLENYFIGKPDSDILTCDKHLLSGITL